MGVPLPVPGLPAGTDLGGYGVNFFERHHVTPRQGGTPLGAWRRGFKLFLDLCQVRQLDVHVMVEVGVRLARASGEGC